MKKFLYYLLAFAGLIIVACEKDVEMPSSVDDNIVESILTVDLPSDTKISFDPKEGYKSAWEKGDKISVEMNGGGFKTYTLDEKTAGTKKGSFSGSGTPKEGGKVFYPAEKWSKEKYTFSDTYYWDVKDYEKGIIHSDMPMVGKVKGTSVSFSYASGALLINYSKIPKGSIKMIIKVGNNEKGKASVGDASLDSDGTTLLAPPATSSNNVVNTITVYLNDQKALEGTPTNPQILIPVPSGTYSSLSMELHREASVGMIRGSHFAMKEGRTFTVNNHDVRKFSIKPNFPTHIAYKVNPGETISDGEYIIVYDRRTDTGESAPDADGNAWVNGDDNLREVIPAKIEILDNHLSFDPVRDKDFFGKEGCILDEADYLTGVWKMKYSSGQWTVTLTGKDPWKLSVVEWDGNYISVGTSKRAIFRYLTPTYLRHNYKYIGEDYRPVTDAIFNNGVFLFANHKSNVQIFKLVTDPREPSSN